MIVDDSFDWLNIHSKFINDIFYEDTQVVSANSAAEALNIYKSEYEEDPFYLVITDLQMESDFEPLKAGEWLINQIREINKYQKILIVSSSFDIEQIANEYRTDYISKRMIISDPNSYTSKLETLYK